MRPPTARVSDLMFCVLVCAVAFVLIPKVDAWPDGLYYATYATVPMTAVVACLLFRIGRGRCHSMQTSPFEVGMLVGAVISVAIGARLAIVPSFQNILYRLIRPLEDAAYDGRIAWNDPFFVASMRALVALAFLLPQLTMMVIGGYFAKRWAACRPNDLSEERGDDVVLT